MNALEQSETLPAPLRELLERHRMTLSDGEWIRYGVSLQMAAMLWVACRQRRCKYAHPYGELPPREWRCCGFAPSVRRENDIIVIRYRACERYERWAAERADDKHRRGEALIVPHRVTHVGARRPPGGNDGTPF